MAWTSYIEVGKKVNTPEGKGTITRLSENTGQVQVSVDGQLFEFPQAQLSDGMPQPETPYSEGGQIRPGDRVKTVDGDRKGTVSEVTQRTVRGKFDDGKSFAYTKSYVAQGKGIERDNEQPGEQGEQGEQDKPDERQKEYEEQREERTQEQQSKEMADDLYGLLNLKDKLEQKIKTEVDGELKELRDAIKTKQTLEVNVGGKINQIQGLRHKQLEQLINYCGLRLSPLMVGMAGTGKTHAGQQTSEALGLQFYSISVGAQTTKTDIMGYMDATGRYIRTLFREAYENGGVFLMDEIDAGNANVLITINAALANGIAAFPDGMVKRHEDFVFIASANTFGNGANRQYVGRNQLDAATLDRFAIIEWLIDDDLEESLAVGLNGKAWYMAVRASRDFVSEKGIRALISPRATQKGSRLIDIGQPLEEVINATLLGSVPDDKKSDVKQVATSIFEKFASEVPKKLSREVDPPTALDLVKDPIINLDDVPF